MCFYDRSEGQIVILFGRTVGATQKYVAPKPIDVSNNFTYVLCMERKLMYFGSSDFHICRCSRMYMSSWIH